MFQYVMPGVAEITASNVLSNTLARCRYMKQTHFKSLVASIGESFMHSRDTIRFA